MVRLNGFEASIWTNGTESTEYDVQENNNNSSCFILTEHETPYIINLKNTSEDVYRVKYTIVIDGIHKTSKTTTSRNFDCHELYTEEGSYGIRRTLKFGKIDIAEPGEEGVEMSKKELANIGTITISVYRCEKDRVYVGLCEDKENGASTDRPPEVYALEINKKMKKKDIIKANVSMSTQMGEAKVNKIASRKSGKPQYRTLMIDTYSKPFVKFVFKYRNKEQLQDMGLLQSTTHVSLETDISAQESRNEDIGDHALASHPSTQRSDQKRKAMTENANEAKKIKSEHGIGQDTHRKREYIDLTVD